LVNDHGITPHELVKLLGKSKAWISKRQSLVQNLTGTVKSMITDGTLCPRTAEEVTKLPEEEQTEFAQNIVNSGINKNEANQLVQRYKNASTDNVRREVIKSPLDALSKISTRIGKRRAAATGLNSHDRRLSHSADHAARRILEVMSIAVEADEKTLKSAIPQLNRLMDIAGETKITLNKILADMMIVFPGKPDTETPIKPDMKPPAITQDITRMTMNPQREVDRFGN
jgi:ParB-like chromosome segregation protein Spo0J